MFPWVVAIVVFELVVATLVIRVVLARRAAVRTGLHPSPLSAVIPALGKLREFSDAIHPRIGEMVRANWSGDADSLPGVLTLAVDEAGREAAAHGIGLDRDMLKRVVEFSVAKHGIAKGGTLREALKRVA